MSRCRKLKDYQTFQTRSLQNKNHIYIYINIPVTNSHKQTENTKTGWLHTKGQPKQDFTYISTRLRKILIDVHLKINIYLLSIILHWNLYTVCDHILLSRLDTRLNVKKIYQLLFTIVTTLVVAVLHITI